MICAATDLNLTHMLRSGITSFYDCIEGPNTIPGCLAAQAEVVRACGMRGTLSFEATERLSLENGQRGLQENLEFVRTIERFNAKRPTSNLVSGLMCFHTTFTCSAAFIRQAFEMAAEGRAGAYARFRGDIRAGTDVETVRDAAFRVLRLAGRGRAVDAGVTVCADQPDGDRHNRSLAGCASLICRFPTARSAAASPLCPILVAAGVTVGLGSDGYITDFFEVMRGAFLIHKAHRQDPRVTPANLIWRLATEGGARAIGLERVGRLAPGWQADLQLIDASFSTPATVTNLYDQLLLYRNHDHVRAVMVAGQDTGARWSSVGGGRGCPARQGASGGVSGCGIRAGSASGYLAHGFHGRTRMILGHSDPCYPCHP